MQKHIKFKKLGFLSCVLFVAFTMSMPTDTISQDYGEVDYYNYAADMHSRLACEVAVMDKEVERLSRKISRIRKYSRKNRNLTDSLVLKLRSLDRTIFRLRSLRNQSRTPLVGNSCPYKPPLDKL